MRTIFAPVLMSRMHGCAIELRLRGVLHVPRPSATREHFHGERRVSRYELETDARPADHHTASHAVFVR